MLNIHLKLWMHSCNSKFAFNYRGLYFYAINMLLDRTNYQNIAVLERNMFLSHNFLDQRKYFSSYRETSEDNIKTLRHIKKIFAIGLFGSTLLIAWIMKKKRLNNLKNALEDCVRIPVNESLFESKISLYRYNGFIFPGQIILSGVFQELPNFKFCEDDVVVASFPKAGTTWVQEIVYMLTHNCKRSDDSSEVLETRFPYLEYPYPGIKSVSKLKGRRFIKTHLPATLLPESFVASGAKLIYITRNPKDIIVSYWHFMRLLTTVNFTGSFKDFLQLFLSDKVPYGPFFEHMKSYSELQKDRNILIVSYENLKENPVNVIKNIAEFLQIPVSEANAQEVAIATHFYSMSKNKSVNYEHWKDIGFANQNEGTFMRKGQVGDWKNYFTAELLKELDSWRLRNDPKEQYKFKYEI